VHLVIQLHPHQYPTNPIQVGLIDTLLLGTTFACFAPLLEHQSPLFNDFETFFKEFNATFGDLDKKCMSNIKIQSFCQGFRLIMIYALKFK
jgi:hypothetical protein